MKWDSTSNVFIVPNALARIGGVTKIRKANVDRAVVVHDGGVCARVAFPDGTAEVREFGRGKPGGHFFTLKAGLDHEITAVPPELPAHVRKLAATARAVTKRRSTVKDLASALVEFEDTRAAEATRFWTIYANAKAPVPPSADDRDIPDEATQIIIKIPRCATRTPMVWPDSRSAMCWIIMVDVGSGFRFENTILDYGGIVKNFVDGKELTENIGRYGIRPGIGRKLRVISLLCSDTPQLEASTYSVEFI